MGLSVLGDLLMDWSSYELDDSIYIPDGVSLIAADMVVNVLPFDPTRKRHFDGQVYLLGIEQVRDVLVGLEDQIGRKPSLSERLKALAHFAKHDAFIAPADP